MRHLPTICALIYLAALAFIPAAQAGPIDVITVTIPNPPLLPPTPDLPIPLPPVLETIAKTLGYQCNVSTDGPNGSAKCFGLCVADWHAGSINPGYNIRGGAWVKTSGVWTSNPGNSNYLAAGYGGGTFTSGTACP